MAVGEPAHRAPTMIASYMSHSTTRFVTHADGRSDRQSTPAVRVAEAAPFFSPPRSCRFATDAGRTCWRAKRSLLLARFAFVIEHFRPRITRMARMPIPGHV